MTTTDVARAALALVEGVKVNPLGGHPGDIRLTALVRETSKQCKRSQHEIEPTLCFACARTVSLAWARVLLERLDGERRRADYAENLLCGIYFDAGRANP